jgi:hypothetical protein
MDQEDAGSKCREPESLIAGYGGSLSNLSFLVDGHDVDLVLRPLPRNAIIDVHKRMHENVRLFFAIAFYNEPLSGRLNPIVLDPHARAESLTVTTSITIASGNKQTRCHDRQKSCRIRLHTSIYLRSTFDHAVEHRVPHCVRLLETNLVHSLARRICLYRDRLLLWRVPTSQQSSSRGKFFAFAKL